jgi:hypothetical protein
VRSLDRLINCYPDFDSFETTWEKPYSLGGCKTGKSRAYDNSYWMWLTPPEGMRPFRISNCPKGILLGHSLHAKVRS